MVLSEFDIVHPQYFQQLRGGTIKSLLPFQTFSLTFQFLSDFVCIRNSCTNQEHVEQCLAKFHMVPSSFINVMTEQKLCAPFGPFNIFFRIGTVKNCETSCISVIVLHSLRCQLKRVGYQVIKYLHGLGNYNLLFILLNINNPSSHKYTESQRSKSGHSISHLP